MKKKKFPLNKVLKYRAYLEKNQAARFRDAINVEDYIDSVLTSHRHNLKSKHSRKDSLISEGELDIKRIKAVQEEILFAQIDENVLSSELVKAGNVREDERIKWIEKKGEADAIDKLKDKFADTVKKDNLDEDQKETDEIACQRFVSGGKGQ
ncbi:hypothetical protein J7L05_04075 [bacterium]|nr:hypothetical protein [bacterium]